MFSSKSFLVLALTFRLLLHLALLFVFGVWEESGFIL